MRWREEGHRGWTTTYQGRTFHTALSRSPHPQRAWLWEEGRLGHLRFIEAPEAICRQALNTWKATLLEILMEETL